MKSTIVAIGAVLSLAAGASATFTEMEMQVQQWGFPLSPGMTTVTFNQFDTQGGTRVLKGVQLEIMGTISAALTAENNSDTLVNDFAASITGIVNIDVGPLSGTLGINAVSPIVPVGPSDNGGLPNGMGPDFADFGTVSGSDNDSALGFPSPFWIGNGQIVGNVDGSGGFATQGTSNATIDFDDFGASGTAKLTYFFDVIPTPGTVGLVGLAGIAAIRRRRA